MSSYSFVAIDPRGRESRGLVEVGTQLEALQRIKQMGLFPLRVNEAARAGVGRKFTTENQTTAPRRWTIRLGSLVVFTRHLATLIDAGMPLLRGLRILGEQQRSRKLKQVIHSIAAEVEAGGSLSEAMSHYPRVFSALYLSMVKAGEVGGFLDETLNRLAESMERSQKLKSKVRAALSYPCAVLAVAFSVLSVLMTVVVPRFEQLFEGLLEGAQLPAFSRFIFQISSVVRGNILLGIVLGATCITAIGLVRRTLVGRRMLDRMLISIPVASRLTRMTAVGRFARTLGTLIGSGVPILQALTIVRDAVGNTVYGQVVASLHQQVKEGEPLAPGLKASPLFPEMVVGMVEIGEQSGALPELLAKVADDCEEQVDTIANALASLLEPALLVMLAAIVGSIVVALFLPLVQLMNMPGG